MTMIQVSDPGPMGFFVICLYKIKFQIIQCHVLKGGIFKIFVHSIDRNDFKLEAMYEQTTI